MTQLFFTDPKGYDFNSLAKSIHENENKKWWFDPLTGKPTIQPRNIIYELIISEIAEVVEAIRKNLMDSHIKHRRAEEVELADILMRTLDYSAFRNFDINKCIRFSTTKDPLVLMDLIVAYSSAYSTFESEEQYITDCIHHIITYANRNNIDIMPIVKEKREYNRDRADHSIEKRMAEGGKRY